MTSKEWNELKVGDLVRHKNSSDAYVVTDNNKMRAAITLVKVRQAHNCYEWNKVNHSGQVISHEDTSNEVERKH